MNVAQRVHWLAAGLLGSPDSYLEMLQSYVTGSMSAGFVTSRRP